MSLLSEAMEQCTLFNRSVVPDGYGGYEDTWTSGVTFLAAIVLDTSIQARVAEKQGVTGLYTITTEKSLNLQFHDVFRRDKDNQFFRVTSNGTDKKTPASASLNMRQVSAETWDLAIDDEDANG